MQKIKCVVIVVLVFSKIILSWVLSVCETVKIHFIRFFPWKYVSFYRFLYPQYKKHPFWVGGVDRTRIYTEEKAKVVAAAWGL